MVVASASKKLPPLDDTALENWLVPALSSVFGEPVGPEGQPNWSFKKKLNKQGRWGLRDIAICFGNEELARNAAWNVRSFYQLDFSFGGIQWNIFTPHFKVDSLEAARLSSRKLPIEDVNFRSDLKLTFGLSVM